MKTDKEIRYDYRRAIKFAETLESTANELEQVISGQVAEQKQILDTSWSGYASELFLRKEEQLSAKVTENAGRLRNISAVIRSNAKRIYDAEMEAYRIAMERNQ